MYDQSFLHVFDGKYHSEIARRVCVVIVSLVNSGRNYSTHSSELSDVCELASLFITRFKYALITNNEFKLNDAMLVSIVEKGSIYEQI